MNHPTFRKQRAIELHRQGVDLRDIAEAIGTDYWQASRLVSSGPPKKVHCDRCGCDLSWHSAIILDNTEFCKPCRDELFADYRQAVAEYPKMFGVGRQRGDR